MHKYYPSNGTEGDWFLSEHCMQCRHCDPDPDGETQCDILLRTLCYTISDPEYPTEWIYDEKGNATCTAHQQWDWETKGNPHDPENEYYQYPPNPNQLKLL